MKGWLKENYGRLLPMLLLSGSILLIPPQGLTREVEAAPGVPPRTMSRRVHRPGLLGYEPGVPICEQTADLVPNPGFEQGIGWRGGWYGGGECEFESYEPGCDSATSARIHAASDSGACMLFTPIEVIRVEPGRHYDYSAWIKTDFIHGEGAAFLRVRFWSLEGDPPSWKHELEALTNSVSDTEGGWVHVTGSAQAPDDAEYARIEASVSASSVGSAWFDDIFLGLATCLDISKTDDPQNVLPGQDLTYTIVYSNTGREKATDLEIFEAYDKYVEFQWAWPSPYYPSDDVWKPPDDLDPGDSDVIAVGVRVKEDVQRAWITNTVVILSEEVPDPIPAFLDTRVITDPPGLDVKPGTQWRSGEPGQPSEYDLILWNSGAFDGVVDLVTCSSFCVVVDVIPDPPYVLKSGESIGVKVSPVMPFHSGCGDEDVTMITASLTCPEFPDMEPLVVTSTLRTIIPSPVSLPVVLRNHDGYFPGPWEDEPNDFCVQANAPLRPGTTYSGCPNSGRPTDQWDFFGIDVRSDGRVTIDLATHIDEGLQLQLRDRDCKFLEYAWKPKNGHYHLEYPGADPGRYYIGVFTVVEHSCESPYRLWSTFP